MFVEGLCVTRLAYKLQRRSLRIAEQVRCTTHGALRPCTALKLSCIAEVSSEAMRKLYCVCELVHTVRS